MTLKRVSLLRRVAVVVGLLVGIAGSRPASAQEEVPQAPIRWFTDQLLAPRPDWYRPELATRRVSQVTRTFRADAAGQLIGANHHALTAGQPVCETLRYDAHGRLLGYELTLLPAKAGGATRVLKNQFSYDEHQRLQRIQVSGTKALLTVADRLSSKAYARWRKAAPHFHEQHHLPAWPAFPDLLPETWQLQSISCGYDLAGRAKWPQAVVACTGQTRSYATATQEFPAKQVVWTDTVPLDPQRDWHLATADTLPGRVDTSWLHHPAQWWQLRFAATAAPGLRVQHQPVEPPFMVPYPRVLDTVFRFTGFFGPTGQLQLARMPDDGTVWRYAYDSQGQPQRVETYCMHLPHRYNHTLYFGGVSSIESLPDCEKRQREAFALPDGQQAVREFQRAQHVRYKWNEQGLPRRAIIQTTTPHYAADVSFHELLSTTRYIGHNGPAVKVKNWRRVQAQLQRRQEYKTRGCVPMKLTTADTQVIDFRYEFRP